MRCQLHPVNFGWHLACHEAALTVMNYVIKCEYYTARTKSGIKDRGINTQPQGVVINNCVHCRSVGNGTIPVCHCR